MWLSLYFDLHIGKRETEDELEKQVSAKKQKRDEAAQNQKEEAKVQKKKEISSDDSDSEEDEVSGRHYLKFYVKM